MADKFRQDLWAAALEEEGVDLRAPVGTPVLGLYSGTCAGGLTEIACGEDGCGEIGYSSTLTALSLTVGQTYYVQLAAYSAAKAGVSMLAPPHSATARLGTESLSTDPTRIPDTTNQTSAIGIRAAAL